MPTTRTRRYRRRRPMRRRRTYRRRARNSATRSSMISAVTRVNKGPLGKMFKMSLPYVEPQSVLNPGLGGIPVFHYFSANGLYDPNITGGGHQPLGFDQVMPMYDHYTVIASKITVTFFNDDATNKQVVGIRLSDQASLPVTADVGNLMENGGGKYAWLNTKGNNGDMVTLTLGCSPKKFFTKTLNDDTYKGSVSSNPADQVYFQIWTAPLTSVDSGLVYFNVRIDYIALFSEPKLLASS